MTRKGRTFALGDGAAGLTPQEAVQHLVSFGAGGEPIADAEGCREVGKHGNVSATICGSITCISIF